MSKKWTKEEQDQLCEEARKKFGPKFWCKPGYQWGDGNVIFWTGEDSWMPDGNLAYDSWSEDYKEVTYELGVHKELLAWAKSKGVFLENYDAGTLLGYPD